MALPSAAMALAQEANEIEPDASEPGAWHVLLCHPLREATAAAHLVGRRFKPYLPKIMRVTTRGARRCKVPVPWPMFPSYLFIRLDMAVDARRLHVIKAIPGINRFFQVDDHYAIVSDADMRRVRQVEESEEKAYVRRTQPIHWDIGEHVRIAEGPFSGLNAEIVRLDDAERITILMSLLGRATKVTLPTVGLEKL